MKAIKVFFCFLICILISTNITNAQWVQTDGLYGGIVDCFATNGTNIFAGTYSEGAGGVFLSTNNGTNWTQVNNGLTSINIYALLVSGTNIFAGTNGGVFLSTDNGTNWTQVGLPNTTIFSLTVSGTYIFAGTWGDGVFLSTNNGTNWTQVNNGLTNSYIHAILVNDTNIYAGTGGGVYLSTNNGTSWTQVNNGLSNTWVYSLVVSGTKIFAGTNDGVFLSTNNGTNWIQVNNGMLYSGTMVSSLLVRGTNIFAGYNGGVYLSTNNGSNWNCISNGLPPTFVYSFIVSGTDIFAGTWAGVFLSSNDGTNWIQVNNGLSSTSARSLAASDANILAGSYSGNGVFLSTNNGTNWIQVNNGLWPNILSLFVTGTSIYAGTWGAFGGVYLSTNNGTYWTKVSNGLTINEVYSLLVNGTNIYVGGLDGVYLSTNNGTNWTCILSRGVISAFAVNGNRVFAGTYGGMGEGVFLSTDNGTNWTQVNNGLTSTNVFSLLISGTNIFAGTNDGVFLSTNNGTNWTQVNNGLTNTFVYSFAVSGSDIFAGTKGGGVFLSTNNGTNWTQVNNGLTNSYVRSLLVSGFNIYAGTDGAGVWKRPLSEMITSVWQADISVKDNGNVSQSLTLGQSPSATDGIDVVLGEAALPPPPFGFDARFHLPNGDESWKDYRLAEKDSIEWLIKFQPGNGGYPITFSWDPAQLRSTGSFSLKDLITRTIVNVNMKTDSSYTLTNSGINALKIELKPDAVPVEVTSFAANSFENNVNITWETSTEKNNSGFEIQRSKEGNVYGKIGFVNGNGTTTEIHKYVFTDRNVPPGKKYYRLKQIDYNGSANYSNAIEVVQHLPTVFSLSQNYPNPFNPSTVIRYGLPGISNVQIKIYNLMGEEVESLVNGTQSAGYHEVTWNASNKASGIYLYTIEAIPADGKGNFRSAKKLILMK